MFSTNSKFILLAVVLALVPALNSQCLSADDTANSPASSLYKGQQAFTLELLDALQQATPSESIFFSPHSTYHALLLAYFGARNATEESLKRVLKLDWAQGKADVSRAYLLDHQARLADNQNRSVDFNSVDKIYTSEETKVRLVEIFYFLFFYWGAYCTHIWFIVAESTATSCLLKNYSLIEPLNDLSQLVLIYNFSQFMTRSFLAFLWWNKPYSFLHFQRLHAKTICQQHRKARLC